MTASNCEEFRTFSYAIFFDNTERPFDFHFGHGAFLFWLLSADAA